MTTIQTKTVTTTRSISSSFSISTLNDSHLTVDDPIAGKLKVQLIEAKPQTFITIDGADYTSLGQWTDSSLNQFLIQKLGLTVITPAPTTS